MGDNWVPLLFKWVTLVGKTTLQLLPEVLVCSGVKPLPPEVSRLFHHIYQIDFIFVSSHIHGPFLKARSCVIGFFPNT